MQIYDEYCPILLNQFKSREYNEFATFDAALDEFYSKIESQKVNQQQKAKEESAAQRLNKIKLDQVSHLTFNAPMQFSYCISHIISFPVGGHYYLFGAMVHILGDVIVHSSVLPCRRIVCIH
jgi:hypothetical protein